MWIMCLRVNSNRVRCQIWRRTEVRRHIRRRTQFFSYVLISSYPKHKLLFRVHIGNLDEKIHRFIVFFIWNLIFVYPKIMFEVWLNFSNFYPMNTSIFLKLHAPILFFLEPNQTHHQHNSINTNIMHTIALLNKEILACSELYLNTNVVRMSIFE